MPNEIDAGLFYKSVLYNYIEKQPVFSITLANTAMRVEITNIGCAIVSIYTKDKNGVEKNIVAGYDDIANYADNPYYMGCILGRYAGRIGGGHFKLDGEEIQLSINDSPNHLHGGFKGFGNKIWQVSSSINDDENVGVVLEYVSKDGEEGYQGNLQMKVVYLLNRNNELRIEYHASTDKKTPINFSNHSYFNLSGFDSENILEHQLYINAEYFAEKDASNIPTGKTLPLTNTPLDFFTKKSIRENIHRFPLDMGFNETYVLKKPSINDVVAAAILTDPLSGRVMTVYTDQPALQLYTANYWDGSVVGKQGKPYNKHGAVALETQAIPDSPNHLLFPNTILSPDEYYFSTTIYHFGLQ